MNRTSKLKTVCELFCLVLCTMSLLNGFIHNITEQHTRYKTEKFAPVMFFRIVIKFFDD